MIYAIIFLLAYLFNYLMFRFYHTRFYHRYYNRIYRRLHFNELADANSRVEELTTIVDDLKRFKDEDALCLKNDMLQRRVNELELYVAQIERYRRDPPPSEVFITNEFNQLG